MLLRTLSRAVPSLLQGNGMSIHTTVSLRGLEDIIPKILKEGEEKPTIGAALLRFRALIDWKYHEMIAPLS